MNSSRFGDMPRAQLTTTQPLIRRLLEAVLQEAFNDQHELTHEAL
jgi:spore coat protein CotF